MAEYYVIRDKNTGLYFRGKGANRWGKYFNQASIYRIKAMAEHSIKEVAWHGEQAEVVPIQIISNGVTVRERGRWIMKETMIRSPFAKNAYCSECLEETGYAHNYCPNCGADMRGEEDAVQQC